MNKMMKKIKEIMQELFLPKEMSTGVIAAVGSFFTVFAVIYLAARHIYDRLPKYDGFIAGLTTLSGYPKQADMQIFTYLLFGLAVCFFLFTVILNLWKKYMRTDKRLDLIFLTAYFGMLLSVFAKKNAAGDLVVLFAAGILLAIPLYFKKGNKTAYYVNLIIILIFAEYSFYGLYSALIVFADIPKNSLPLFQIGQGIVFLFVFAAAFGAGRLQENFPFEKLLFFSQMLLPAGLIGFYRFRYAYEGAENEIILYPSNRWKYFLILAFVLMAGYEIVCLIRHKKGIMLTSLFMIGMMQVYTMPGALLNIDYFHNGEITVPMQQLMSYGKLPYLELIPIHGFCDYFYGAVNYLFFDGSYMALNASLVIGNLFMICFLSVVVYFFLPKKGQALIIVYLFSVFLIQTAGMRYLFLFAMFFIMFSEWTRRDAFRYLWCWVMLSIMAIAWNPSIGGAAAIAFLPVMLYRIYSEGFQMCGKLIKPEGTEGKKYAVKVWISYGILFVTGICFIPLFLRIVVYLRENTGTTLSTNGMGMVGNLSRLTDYFVPGLFTGAGSFFIKTFALLIPFLLCLFFALCAKQKENRKQAAEYAVCLFVCYFVISNYAFVRFDNGLRTKVVGLFFSILIVFSLLLGKSGESFKSQTEVTLSAFVLVFCLSVSDAPVIMHESQVCRKGEVAGTQEIEIMGEPVSDPIVYVTGNSVGIENLGDGFIGGNALNNLKNIDAVLDGTIGDRGAYVDLTNAVANYVIFNKESILSYTSGYNISNELMQENAVSLLKEKEPDLILIAPYIQFDGVTISLRSGKLYDYIMEAGYVPYLYENVIYLLKNLEPVPGSMDGTIAFAELMHKESLQYLPAVWGNSGLSGKLSESNIRFSQSDSPDGGTEFTFEETVDGSEISYIGIHVDGGTELLEKLQKYDSLAKGVDTNADGEVLNVDASHISHLTVAFESNVGETLQTKYFTAYLYGDEYLIPVKSSPYWSMEKELSGFRIYVQDSGTLPQDVTVTLYTG